MRPPRAHYQLPCERLARAVVRTVLIINDTARMEYLSSRVLLPERNSDGEPQHYRVGPKLGMVLPHLMRSLKRRILPVFVGKLKLTKESVSEAQAKLGWLVLFGSAGPIEVFDRPAVPDRPQTGAQWSLLGRVG